MGARSPRDVMRRAWPAVIGLAIFLVAMAVLRSELRLLSWHTLVSNVVNVPVNRLALAFAFTALNYLVLTGYDLLAFSVVDQAPPRRWIVFTSFLAYAFSNAVGFAVLTGTSVRHRFYSRFGVTTETLARVVFFCSLTFWVGLFALGGASLIVSPPATALPPAMRPFLWPAGWLMISVPLLYLLASTLRPAPIRIRQFQLRVPSPSVAVGQMTVSSIDWALAAAGLFVLLPASELTFVTFLGIFPPRC